jgi:hypothetical protein
VRLRGSMIQFLSMSWVLLGWIAVLMLSAAAVVQADSDEPQSLVFAWPAGLDATVTYEATSSTGQSSGSQPRTLGRYRMISKALSDGLEISFSEHALDLGEGFVVLDEATDSRLKLYAAASREPGLVVDGQGKLLRFEGMEEIKRATRQPVEQMLAALPETARQLARQMYDPTVQDRQIEARARQRWDRLVGLWSGVAPGSAWRAAPDGELALQSLPHLQIPVKRRIRRVGTEPCGDHVPGLSCALLELHTELDVIKLPGVLEAYAARAPDVEVFGVAFEQWVRLSTEPQSLRPHRIEVDRNVSVEAKKPRREINEMRVDKRTSTYRYRQGP